jgi:hypothetical protein
MASLLICGRHPVPASEMSRNIADHISTNPTANASVRSMPHGSMHGLPAMDRQLWHLPARMSPPGVSRSAMAPVSLKVSVSASPSRPARPPKPGKRPHSDEKVTFRNLQETALVRQALVLRRSTPGVQGLGRMRERGNRRSNGPQTLSTHAGKRFARKRCVGR